MNIQIPRYSEQLRKLTDDYFYQQISTEEYRLQRKQILDAIDRDINHIQPAAEILNPDLQYDYSKF